MTTLLAHDHAAWWSELALGDPRQRGVRDWAVREHADHPLAEPGRADPKGSVETVEVDDGQVCSELNELLITEVLLHLGEQLVGDLDWRPHYGNGVVERELLAWSEQVTLAVARE